MKPGPGRVAPGAVQQMGAIGTMSTEEYGRGVRRVLLTTLALNLLVTLAKTVAGILSGSLSVLSDAVHSSADSLNNMVGLFIVRLARKAPDREHPYGHQKFETLAAFAIAGFLLVTAFEIASGSVRRLLGWSSSNLEVTPWTLGAMLGTLSINVFVWHYERRRGRELNSSFLLADANHTLSDIFITAAILGGLLAFRIGGLNLDAYLALGVVAVIILAAYQIFSATIPILVDSAPLSSEYIAGIVRATPGVRSVHEILSRGVPGKIFISMHLVVHPTGTVEAHAVTEEVEKRLEKEVGPCQVVVHVEPESYEE